MGKHKPEQTRIPMQSVSVYSTNDQLRQNGRLITQNTHNTSIHMPVLERLGYHQI
jgi:hypothetical protein